MVEGSGPDNVMCGATPSHYSSNHSRTNAGSAITVLGSASETEKAELCKLRANKSENLTRTDQKNNNKNKNHTQTNKTKNKTNKK